MLRLQYTHASAGVHATLYTLSVWQSCSLIFMSGRLKQRSRKYRARRLINSEQFWDLIFDLIQKGQNLPAISKALDVPYRTLWGWINESDENRQRYDGARKEQDEMIRLKILDYEAKNLFKYGE